jgi:serine/threonine-protein kinase
VEAAFRGAGTPAAAGAFEHIDRALAGRVGAIRAMRRDACVATAVRHQESPVLFDRRMQCLDRRGEEIRALTSVMAASPDRTAINRAVEAAVSLPPVDACADRDALLAAVPLPDDRAVRARVAALDARLERGKALDKAGKFAEALALVNQVLADAERVPYPPLRARAHFALASVESSLGDYDKAENELRSTVALAAAARDDELVARIWLLLYKTVGFDESIVDKAAQVEPAVAAAVERAGGNHELRGNLNSVRGIIEMRSGEYAPSVEHLETALGHLQAAFGRESSRVADVLQAKGQSLEGVGKFDEARAALEEAERIRVKLLGPEHQNVGMSEKALGVLFDTMGKPAEALPHFQRAVDIFEKVLPPDHPTLANALSSLGVVLDNVDRSREALPHHLRAVAILEKRGKDAEVALSYAVSNLGVSYMEQERNADAFRAYERALALKEKLLGPDHPTVGHTLCSMGVAARRTGDLKRAEALCRRSLAILQKKLGPDHPECADPMGSLAETLLVAGRPAEALPLIAKARAIAEKEGGLDTASYGETLFLHGRVLAALRRAPEGLSLMGRGLDLMRKFGDKKKNIAEAERLLAAAREKRR